MGGVKKGWFRQDKRGQTAVEYLLTTLVLVVVFATMYGYLHRSLKKLFIQAGVVILTSYQ